MLLIILLGLFFLISFLLVFGWWDEVIILVGELGSVDRRVVLLAVRNQTNMIVKLSSLKLGDV